MEEIVMSRHIIERKVRVTLQCRCGYSNNED